MSSDKIVKFMMAMLVALAVQVSASDDVLICDYAASVKWFDDHQDKIVTVKDTGYFVFSSDLVFLGQVWYYKIGTRKVYEPHWAYDEEPCYFFLDVIGSKGLTANFYSGSCLADSLDGLGTIKRTNGSISSLSLTGTRTEPGVLNGTFSMKNNTTLTKKANSYGLDAMELIISELQKKGYTSVY